MVHAHPPYVAIMSAMGKPLLPAFGGYHHSATAMAARGIMVCNRTVMINNEERAQDMVRAMKGENLVLLKGHGLAAAAKTIEAAATITIAAERLAKMNFLACLIGDPKPIPHAELEDFLNPRPDGGKPWSARAVFRFYEELIHQGLERENEV